MGNVRKAVARVGYRVSWCATCNSYGITRVTHSGENWGTLWVLSIWISDPANCTGAVKWVFFHCICSPLLPDTDTGNPPSPPHPSWSHCILLRPSVWVGTLNSFEMLSPLPRGAETQNAPPPECPHQADSNQWGFVWLPLEASPFCNAQLCLIFNFLPFAVFFINTTGTGAKSQKCRLYPLACDACWELLAFIGTVNM